ncbi:mannonate dehydratase [Filimonas effusa]|uniref:Mannonate dehydratase n=1 Tax=Filimonas effusa TaxID=2508721 RepID=A0A4Q1DDG9_9BACT|nr:mannonate dehydratase [Filimonas effusa]RXK86925.1 mannonate dehydratase [Filimonas effusa]
MSLEKTWRWFGKNDKVTLAQLKQFGVEGIVTALHHIKGGAVWPVEEIQLVKEEIEKHGMRWSVVESLPVTEGIKTNGPEREELVRNYITSMRNLAACGIDTICYNFMPVLDWARTDLHFVNQRGAESMLFHYETFAAFDVYILERPGAEKDYAPEVLAAAKELIGKMTEEEKNNLAYNIIVVTQGFINGTVGNVHNYKQVFLDYLKRYDTIDTHTLRNHLALFLNDIIPVAEELGIRMCIHPDDPPFPLLGLPRIASTMEDFEWIFSACPSVNNGLTFCSGSLSVREDNDLVAIAKKFAERIHFVHLRNIISLGGRSFYESAHLEGVVDMYAVLKALLEEQKRRREAGRSDLRMPFRPDHGLKILDDFSRESNPGYPLVGRMKGLAEITGLEMGIERMLYQ